MKREEDQTGEDQVGAQGETGGNRVFVTAAQGALTALNLVRRYHSKRSVHLIYVFVAEEQVTFVLKRSKPFRLSMHVKDQAHASNCSQKRSWTVLF